MERMFQYRLTGARLHELRVRQWGGALVLAASWACAIFAGCAVFWGCALDKLTVVEGLCPPSSRSPDCVADEGVRTLQEGDDEGPGPAPSGPDVGGAGAGGDSEEGPLPELSAPDKLDLLFMIDNSISMRDKQNVLELVNASLLTALATPPCVPQADVASPLGGGCPEGEAPAFSPITDIHIGFISSSLGDVGAQLVCPTIATLQRYVPDRADMGHLIGSLPRGANTGATVGGFLEWTAGMDVRALNNNFQRSLRAVGEAGCGWEMSLESWYRFLIDPNPYRALERVVCPGSESTGLSCVQPATDLDLNPLLDDELLAQRQAFLRPDSLVAIVMLTDENDCSIEAGLRNWVVAALDDPRPMFRGSSSCETNPNHPCCYSCELGVPAGCEDEQLDPICTSGELENRLPAEADGQNLRCFEQRRRFGTDFLYPTARYVNALRNRELCLSSSSLEPADCVDLLGASSGSLVPNPLYAGGQRDPADVFLVGIVGVPWQDLAASVDARGNALPANELRYKSAAELTAADWANILGDPRESPPLPPDDPFMRESALARAGITPGNPINGREYDTGAGTAIPDDLQYACIFPLPQPRDCNMFDPNLGDACDCFAGNVDRPLCEETPGSSPAGTTQYWAKAYPGLRQLDVLRGYGENSVVTSICARNVEAVRAAQPDFAYRPALNAVVERLTQRLGAR